MLLKKPTERNKAFKIFKPLNISVWMSIPATMFLACFVIYVVAYYSPFDRRQLAKRWKRKCARKAAKKSSATNTIWLGFGTFLEQGADFYPKAQSGRIIVMFWWFFTIIILATYTADLAAYLTVPDIPAPLRTLEELVNQDTIRPIIADGGSTLTLMRTSKKGTTYRRIGEMIEKMGMPYVGTIDQAFSNGLMEQGTWAALADYNSLNFIKNENCGKYVFADERYNVAGVGLVIPKNAYFKEAFIKSVNRMLEAGLVKRWTDKWNSINSKCFEEKDSNLERPIDTESIVALLVILAACMILGGLSLLVEIIFIKCGFQLPSICRHIHHKYKTEQEEISITETNGRDVFWTSANLY
ncbi:glutamate receptor 2-like [Tubulanus polymorphus]|uniref:glutamate receptor 2-like n=1 Tax=Tubulanus polymorphus TaxID=672921 RepID=UPI003DA1D341